MTNYERAEKICQDLGRAMPSQVEMVTTALTEAQAEAVAPLVEALARKDKAIREALRFPTSPIKIGELVPILEAALLPTTAQDLRGVVVDLKEPDFLWIHKDDWGKYQAIVDAAKSWRMAEPGARSEEANDLTNAVDALRPPSAGRREEKPCATCNGRGRDYGYFQPYGYGSIPCPKCAKPQAPEGK